MVEVQLEFKSVENRAESTRDLGLIWQNVDKVNGSNREKPGMERWDESEIVRDRQ